MHQEISRCREAVPELIAEAYRKYFAFWRNLARASQVSDEDARDIVHSILANILAREDMSFESLEHVRNYVAKSVLNRAIQNRQRSSRRIPLDEDVGNLDTEWDEISAMERDEEKTALRVALRGLSARDFEIIKLRFFGGLTFAEIGHVMGMPVSTLKSREEAALRRIRKRLCASGVVSYHE